MKRFSTLLVAITLAIVLSSANVSYAQEDTMKKIGTGVVDTTKTVAKKTARGSKAVYKGGKRVGYTVGNKTWNGTKWVASRTWRGGKWIAVKTKHGVKWVWRGGKRAKRAL